MNGAKCAFIAVLFGVFALGCVNLDPVPDETRFYTLGDAPMDVAEYSGDELRVGVRVSWVAPYLRKTGIVTRTKQHEIQYSSNHRWAGRLDGSMTRLLVLGLREELPDLSVVPLTGIQPLPPAYVVEVMVSACEGTGDGRASLELSWRVLAEDFQDKIITGGFSELKPGWDQADYELLARLLTQLGREAAGYIAADIRQAVARSEAGPGS